MARPGYAATLIAGESIAVTVDGQTTTVASDARNFEDLVAAVKAHAPKDKILALLTPLTMATSVYKDQGFEIRKHPKTGAIAVFADDVEVDTKLGKMIADHYLAGDDFGHLKNFFLKARQSKSLGNIDVLYEFVSFNKLPIHPDGDFFAFKATRPNGTDKHSGTVLYKIGEYNDAPDFDPNEYTQCGRGLHVGGRSYVKFFASSGDKVFIVKVNPANAIFYRSAGEGGKMRVRKLFCYAEISGKEQIENALAFTSVLSPEGDLLQAAADAKLAKKVKALADAQKNESEPSEYLPLTDGEIENGVQTDPADDATAEAQQAADRKQRRAARKTRKAERELSQAMAQRIAAERDERKARHKVARAKRKQTFVGSTRSKNREVLKTVTNKDGVAYTAKQILAGLKEHGQRGFAAISGLPRTSLQEWWRELNGLPARVR